FGSLRSVALVASILYFSATAVGSDSLTVSTASALPLNSALANGAATSPVTVSLIKRRRFVSAAYLVMGDSFCLRCEVDSRAGAGLRRQIGIVAGFATRPVIKILSWPCLLKETWHSFLKLDNPMLVKRLRPCRLQLWMRFKHAL